MNDSTKIHLTTQDLAREEVEILRVKYEEAKHGTMYDWFEPWLDYLHARHKFKEIFKTEI